jgi:hypothetical protein
MLKETWYPYSQVVWRLCCAHRWPLWTWITPLCINCTLSGEVKVKIAYMCHVDVAAIQRIVSTEDSRLKNRWDVCFTSSCMDGVDHHRYPEDNWLECSSSSAILRETFCSSHLFTFCMCVTIPVLWWHSSTCWNLLSVLLYHYQLQLYCYRHKGLWACCSIVCVCVCVFHDYLITVKPCYVWAR